MKPLSLAVIHLAYRERGGEDAVVESEVRALQARGHRVTPLIFSTDDALPGRRHRLVRELKDAVVKANPDVVHVHNLFPLTMFDSHVVVGSAPVVKTLHNYRVACLAGSHAWWANVPALCRANLENSRNSSRLLPGLTNYVARYSGAF